MRYTRSVLGLTLVLLSATLARAQAPSRSFADLQARLQIGEKVEVIDITGKKFTGRFEAVSGASFRLLVDGMRQEFLEGRIREVRKRRPESRWDGALYGLGIGAVVGILNVRSVCHDASERSDCYAVGWAIVLPLFAAGGAGSGALVDFAIKRNVTVFAPAVRSGHRFGLSPMLDARRKGLALSVSF